METVTDALEVTPYCGIRKSMALRTELEATVPRVLELIPPLKIAQITCRM